MEQEFINKYKTMLEKYQGKINRLNAEMKRIPASIPWGIKSGKVEAYEEMIVDLKNLDIDNKKSLNDDDDSSAMNTFGRDNYGT